ncbi:3D domain-containing protein [Kamptonema cortianum]|nr:3D domain-containing protein [Geitlerinema splendidum]MDK3158739.1 3D domain-containing protein [Kamptonema cortianum]
MRKLTCTGLGLLTLLLVHPIVAIAQELPYDTTEVEVKTETIPYEVKYVFNRSMSAGRIKKVTDGVTGSKVVTLTHYLKDGKVIKTEKAVEETPAEPAVFHMGRSGFNMTDRGSFTRAKLLEMESTAYLPTDGGGHGITASGRRADFGVVAVDPRVIPLGTLLFVEGYGFAIAADTGGAIKGNKIDVCLKSRRAAMQWGRRKVKVHIFNGRHTQDIKR